MKTKQWKKAGIVVSFLALAAIALSGCSGGGSDAPVSASAPGAVSAGSSSVTETPGSGLVVTQSGTVAVPAGKSVAAAVGATGNIGKIEAFDAMKGGTALGSAAVMEGGVFSGLTFTLPAYQSVILFKATLTGVTDSLYYLMPIDLTPTSSGVSTNTVAPINVNSDSTTAARLTLLALGATIDLTTPIPAAMTFAQITTVCTDNGVLVLARVGNTIQLTGTVGGTAAAASVNVATMSLSALGAVIDSATATVDGVTIATSTPVVKFTVKDTNGNGVAGLGARNTATSARPAQLLNLRFGIAKLVPGTNGSPSKWVNYIVTTPGNPTATTPVLPVATMPTTDREGTLVDKGNGSYTYTFYRDLAKIKDTAGVTDVTYDGTLTHRLVLTVTLGTDPTSGKFPKTVNVIKEFTIDPTTKAAIDLTATSARRDITTTAKCNSCHVDISKWSSGAENDGGHFDTRPDVRNCISCHNDQLRIGSASAVSTAGAFPLLTTAQKADRRNTPRILDGEVMFDFPIMIHKIHNGRGLTKTNVWSDGLDFNAMAIPQEVINCRKCHSGDTTAELAAASQGNNWKNVPSRLACGSCHDNINWTTGANHPGIGGARTDDSACTLCHSASYIETKHTSVNATPNNPSVPEGAANFSYEIDSVTVGTGADLGKPIVKFRIMKVVPPATTATAVTFVQSVGGTAPLTGFTGAPSFLVAYAMLQDGITAPADFNNRANGMLHAQPVSVSIAKLCDTSVTATATVGSQGSMTGPDASGYYTATLTGPTTAILATTYGATTATAVTATATVAGIAKGTAKTTVGMLASPAMPANPAIFPAGANLRTVALQGYFTQVAPALARHSTMVMKAVGETSATVRGEARRLVVDSAKCAKCHEYFEGHGGNRNYNMDGCTVCHVPNLSSSGTIINDPTAPEATQNLKDMIHGIHAAGKRTTAYKHTRSKTGSNTVYDWSGVVYPAKLNNCLVCHKTGTYGSVPAAALATVNTTPTNGTSVFDARTKLPNITDTVISPFSAACVSCHDSTAAKAHMSVNGGVVNAVRGAAPTYATSESCTTCHGVGKTYGVDVVHE